MTLRRAVTVLGVIIKITIGTVTCVVCDVACVGVFIGSVGYHCYFMFLPYIALNGSICEG